MRATVKFEGLEEIEKAMKTLEPRLSRSVLSKELRARIRDIGTRIRAAAPKDTGNLRKSIRWRVSTKRLRAGFINARVYVDTKRAPHWHLVEFGARGGKMPAKPYIRPMWERLSREAVETIRMRLRARLKRLRAL